MNLLIKESQNRYRVSSGFTLVKVALALSALGICCWFVEEVYNNSLNLKIIVGFLLGLSFVALGFNFFQQRKIIEYDDVKQVLYVLDNKSRLEIQIPIERIDEIHRSGFGFQYVDHGSSYLIFFKDDLNQSKKIRLFPILGRKDGETIIEDAKLKNPKLVVTKLGLN